MCEAPGIQPSSAKGTGRIPLLGETLEHVVYSLQDVAISRNE
jgi:hypothetical protein